MTSEERSAPLAALIIPCHNEATYLGAVLDVVLAQLAASETPWPVYLVDDASTDGTGAMVDASAAARPWVTVVRGVFGSPGAARSAGVAAALARHRQPGWLVTVDADVEIDDGWLTAWTDRLTALVADEACGAVNGDERQDHIFAPFPHAAQVSATFGAVATCAEQLVGVTNLNGVNHAVRTSAYLTAGPYLQPSAPGPGGPVHLAGSDWDLGVRVRLAGFTIATCDAMVRDRGRRVLADVAAYVSGHAYEGPFARVHPAVAPQDIDAAEVASLSASAVERSLRHFFFKPVLAGVVPLDHRCGLRETTLAAMRAWIERWPAPTFAESRNGFVYGRLGRFSAAFVDDVCRDLDLDRLPAPR